MHLQLNRVQEVLPRIEPGLKKYKLIMSIFKQTDVSNDRNFQKMYNGFYRVRRNQDWCILYYNYMQEMKESKYEVLFENTLKYIFDQTQRIEPSFSSKLVATINDSLPIWDKFVLQNTGFRPPNNLLSNEERIKNCLTTYNQIILWYEEALKCDSVIEAINLFDKKYPESGISDIKKIDLILWQTR
jgi:hypothetical protein